MKENMTGVGMILRNANKRKIPLEFYIMPILKVSKEEAKKMYPAKNSSSTMCRKSNRGVTTSLVGR